ncbi:MAG: hypothetical protein GY859_37025, partial [Desulfobacterales bacterium]|nr:hypothetical protein [Desulfobacterales bacterium]
VTLTITGQSDQTVSDPMVVTVESIQVCGPLEATALSGSEIFTPHPAISGNQYRYGPSIILDGDTVHMWASAEGPGLPMDLASYKKGVLSEDGVIAWETADWKSALEATPYSADRCSVCDPSVVYFNNYYYIGYTSTSNCIGGGRSGNQVFAARCNGLPDGSPDVACGKWNGSDWGGLPQPIIAHNAGGWGIGQPSFVVKDDILFIYYTDSGTKVIQVDATDENWPGSIDRENATAVFVKEQVDETTYHTRFVGDEEDILVDGSPGPLEVKYIDELSKFIGVVVLNEFSAESNIVVCESDDGVQFRPVAESRSDWTSAPVQERAHNIGISGDGSGHMTLNANNFIAYGYGSRDYPKWSTWLTMIEVDANQCELALSPTALVRPAESGAASFDVLTSDDSTAWTASSNASWLTIASGASGVGDGSVTLDCDCNTGEERTGSITISAPDAANSPRTFTLIQAAAGVEVDGVQIFNDGSSPLQILAIQTQSSGSWLTPALTFSLPHSIEPGGSRDVAIFINRQGLAPGVYNGAILITTNDPVNSPLSIPVSLTVEDSDQDGLSDAIEDAHPCLNAHDPDSDDDGVPDGVEDADRNGAVNADETDPCERDTDGDELSDGVEDANQNGLVDSGETDPTL